MHCRVASYQVWSSYVAPMIATAVSHVIWKFDFGRNFSLFRNRVFARI